MLFPKKTTKMQCYTGMLIDL